MSVLDQLGPEERKQLALLGSMLSRPVSEEERKLQERLDAYVDATTEKERTDEE